MAETQKPLRRNANDKPKEVIAQFSEKELADAVKQFKEKQENGKSNSQ